MLMYLISVAGMAAGVYGLLLLQADGGIPWLFGFEYALVPAGIAVFMLVMFFHRSVLEYVYARASVAICATVIILYALLLVFVVPSNVQMFQDTAYQQSFKERIREQYDKAQSRRNLQEMSRYAILYKKFFPSDTEVNFEAINEILGANSQDVPSSLIENVFAQKKKDEPLPNAPESDLITSLSFTNIDRDTMLQRAADLMEDGRFYAARLALLAYEKQFDPTARFYQISQIVGAHIADEELAYPERQRVQLQRQMQYLYSRLASSDNDDIIAAYGQLTALRNMYPDDAQLRWLFEAYTQRLALFTFFAEDARAALLKPQTEIPVILVNSEAEYFTIWAASDVAYLNGATYFENLELVRVAGTGDGAAQTKKFAANAQNSNTFPPGISSGNVLWRVSAPYAKLSGGLLMLSSMERGATLGQNKPAVLMQNSAAPAAPRWTLDANIAAGSVQYASPRPEFLQAKSIVSFFLMIAPWTDFSLPVGMLRQRVFHDTVEILLFALVVCALAYLRIAYVQAQRGKDAVDKRARAMLFLAHMGTGWAYLIVKTSYEHFISVLTYEGLAEKLFQTMLPLVASLAVLVIALSVSLAVVKRKSMELRR